MSEAILRQAPSSDRTPRRILREDYRPPIFLVRELELEIELGIPITRVAARLKFARNDAGCQPLRLDGVGLKVLKVEVDGAPLAVGEYSLDDAGLTIFDPPSEGELRTLVEIDASAAGTEGLLVLGDTLVTNCEPEGFRRITFFPDRPDILTRMTCTLSADAREYPMLLANGSLREAGSLPNGRHFACWEDHFPKASYLFALVAGRFNSLTDCFTTVSGRKVKLAVYAQSQELRYCEYGLAMLKKAMEWDEQAYGREYDLDVLNVVVMRSYPGGAMECKGLNLYSTEFFLASPQISTDEALLRVAATVGHEYFHNWTGNRVGCRDWFQLSLKEGFTVLRQQQFLAALTAEAGARIDDVTRLRDLQYPEDDGGLAHAVRPASYMAINNFYTRTVYEKGAEIIRMMSLIVGERSFAAAAREFFAEYDLRAATLDSFVDTIERVSGVNLAQFRRWFDTAGRPRLEVRGIYDLGTRRYTLSVDQHLPDRHESHGALHIPVRLGLLDSSGQPLYFKLAGSTAPPATNCVLELREPRETFILEDVPSMPVPSILRGFSAPVDVHNDLSDRALAMLAMHDSDGFNRWEAAQQLATRVLHSYSRAESGTPVDAQAWFDVVAHTLENSQCDAAFAGRMLRLPSWQQLAHSEIRIDLDALHAARSALRVETARRFGGLLRSVRTQTAQVARANTAFDVRRLRNRCLWYLAYGANADGMEDCREQYRSATSMEDVCAALQLLVDGGGTQSEQALHGFHSRWQQVPAALDHWYAVQALSEAADCLERVEYLTGRDDFSLANATRLKAVFDSFTANPAGFHHRSGRGYAIVSRVVLALNGPNPRLAARFLKRFDGWHRYDATRGEQMAQTLRRVLASPVLATDLYEIASESLRVGNPMEALRQCNG